MTIKGKRAKALPIMGAPSWSTGGMVDESLPPEAYSFIQENAKKLGQGFDDWFSGRLGRYRAYSEMSQAPTVSEELALVRSAQHFLHETQKRLEHLPPTADAYVNEAAWRRNGRFFHYGLFSDFEALSAEIDTLLAIAEQALDSLPKKSGRKAKTNRDGLLADVVSRLVENGLKKREASAVAAELLGLVGVETPEGQFEIERLARKPGFGKIDAN